jgi:Domain of unknown function DUF29
MDVDTTCRYEDDFLLWTQVQAKLLRQAAGRGINFPLDWENLAEEVESLGRSERRELRKRLRTIIEHLLKLQYAEIEEPRRGWEETVRQQRLDVKAVLEDNPSLRREVPNMIHRLFAESAPWIAEDLVARGEADPLIVKTVSAHPYSEEQVLGSEAVHTPRRS